MSEILSLPSACTLKLKKQPCCIEFSPTCPDYFVVGTYNLLDDGNDATSSSTRKSKGQVREGSLELYHLFGNDILLVQELSFEGGVLDVHFSESYVGISTSVGSLVFYHMLETNGSVEPRLAKQLECLVAATSSIVTAFAFGPDRLVCFTASSGLVGLVQLPAFSGTGLKRLDIRSQVVSIGHHELEAWYPTWAVSDDHGSRSVLSGGDDQVLQEISILSAEEVHLKWSNRKVHGAGVTSILSLHNVPELGIEDLLLTGSYDDHLRLLRLPRWPKTVPTVLAEINLGGGVWRLKVVESKKRDDNGVCLVLAVAGMYAGAFIVECNIALDESLDYSFSIRGRFEEHESMCYGIDIQPKVQDNAQRRVLSCSFYDRRLCLWNCADTE